MKLKDYIKQLQEVAKKNPNALVVYSKDDEGNCFSELHFSPSLGSYGDGEFVNDDGTDEFSQQFKVNAVCLN